MTPPPVDLTALRLATRAAQLCVGSGSIIRAERTDGNGVTACPHCHRFRATLPAIDDYRTVEIHNTLWVGQ